MPKKRKASAQPGAADEDERKLYCHCKTPHEEGAVYIACEICDNWFHPACVGLGERESLNTLPKNFMCRTCQSEGFLGSSGEGWYLESTSPPAKKQKAAAAPSKKKQKKRKLPKGDEVVRSKVRAKLTEALSVGLAAERKAEAEGAATRAEEAMLILFAGTGADYKAKARELSFNLKDALNENLRRSVLNGSIAAEQLVRMSSTQLANEQARLKAEAIEQEKVRTSLKHKSQIDMATMDRDGTVHWKEAAAEQEGDAGAAAGAAAAAAPAKVTAPAAATTPAAAPAAVPAAAKAPAAAPAAAAPPQPSRSQPAAPAASAAPAAAATTAAAASPRTLRTQEELLMEQIAALPPEVVASLPLAQRQQFEKIVAARAKAG